ncbi:nuclear transport factor 2 family protein [Streptomyces sp. NBC_01481]|uniref:nuclear transport factor 2 family protein n=1 Tax=Streptomyces sp. NBC_01481 TaxID=2975869 RepID=UPI002255CD76|nr:nuclear transport factor 2 family protein [Streptomyces sp. NBC_01481]MCX4583839.1 nuclear transport factor 2 family protein [Streptomyces sp. NBC_01481]
MNRSTSATELHTTVETYWSSAEARDWTGFAATLAEDVVYDLPQTREKIRGKEECVRFNREYPGDWHVRIQRIVADSDQAVTWIHVTVGLEEMYAVTFFTGDKEGRITTVTDFWPEAYEPPPGREHLVERY